ncbi:hypothetical protein DAEQUDRAFT_375362 [Daedalea quercina L-15889]|uniref:Fungal-type protein kinase domain-containing protein n=1 Tax=Daedalea quercina L-15889 TaxID=1314783 RepID=A0A165P7R0_9APHY|nr:hypothetical protein DAEQUDRAFT_375362 [Daedalea quercina L-15889]
MNNLMSSNVRSFGIGWLVEDNNMRLWYGDRMGIVVTRKFRFLHGDHRLFLRCIAAMGRSSVHGMGIFPDLHFPGNSPSGPPQLKQYKGAQLRITAKRPDASEPEYFEFDVDEQAGRIYTEFGVLGRGTSVIPIRARSDTSKHFQDERLVAKVSWPHALRKAEDSLIIAVRKGLAEAKPQYLQHIVDLKCSVTRTIEELGLPRVVLGLYPDAIDLRVCRTLVMKSYERLELVESVEDFKTVYVDVVRAHYWVWTTTRTLHRDISTNNIMWFRDRDGKVIGVLCDWDLAEQNLNGDIPPTVTDERPAPENPPAVALGAQSGGAAGQADSKVRSSNALKPGYRTGTGPFMALDLLRQGTPPAHLYRHDLESFLYLLAYVCAVWDPENKRFGRMHAWERETLTEIWANKHGFLKQREVYDEVFKHAHPSLKHLTEYGSETSWIPTLAAVFSLIEAHTSTIQALQSVQSNLRRGPPAAALEARIRKEEADRENEISYEIFMEILGASLDI